MNKTDCIKYLNFYLETEILRIMHDAGILTDEEFLRILKIAEQQTGLKKYML